MAHARIFAALIAAYWDAKPSVSFDQNTANMKRVVIIGGGITGLAAAHRIAERNATSEQPVRLTLLESSSRVGGIVQTAARDGFLIEAGPDSFLSEKPAALDLIQRLGLERNLIETNESHRRTFIVRRGRLVPLPTGFQLLAPSQIWPFITSDIFSWHGKARMALDLVLPRRLTKGDSDDESLAHFVRRRLGREALERMAQPMIGGIYTADPEKLSLRATMPRFLEMERQHRSLIRALRKKSRSPTVRKGLKDSSNSPSPTSGPRYSLFLSFDSGMQLLTDRLAARISDLSSRVNGSEDAIRLQTGVASLALDRANSAAPKWLITTDRGETLSADALCLALPAHVCGRLLRPLDESLAAELEQIEYASSATINLAYQRADIPHALDGFGFVVPFIEKRTIIACSFSSVKFAGRAPEGGLLLRAFVGGALQPEVLELDEDELIARVRGDLRDLLGIVASPIFAELKKWERSMPQYHVGHLARVRRINERVASLPQIALAGNAYHGPGIPDCIRSGEEAVASRESPVVSLQS